MRLVVTGGTGNVGTALLQRVGDVAEVTAIATGRPPPVAPYDRATWVSVDLRTTGDGALAELMRGADAVVHLAWDVTGAGGRESQRRTNVVGTGRVLAAAIAAGVPHLVYPSSVAAYSPEPTRRVRVSEHWPRAGIPGSPYSADKVSVERMLDHAVQQHPRLRVARLRPPAILAPAAAGELSRYALGRLAPLVRHRLLRPPVLPLPASLTTQVVHAADVADVIWRILDTGGAGAYNIAAEPVLDAATIAASLRMHRIPAPKVLVGATMTATAAARVQPLDASWLRMLTTAPLVATYRARHELGWEPAHRGDQVLTALRDAAVAGTGAASDRLAPAR